MPPRSQAIFISTQSEVEDVLPNQANLLDLAFSLRAVLQVAPGEAEIRGKSAKLYRISMSAGRPAGRR